MQISEVTSTVNKMSLDEVVRYLEDRGYEELGSGIHAIVMHKPGTPYCVKVYEEDEAYTKFYQLCMQQWKNDRHLPRVYGMGKWLDQFGVVRIELLSSLSFADDYLLRIIKNYAFKPELFKGKVQDFKDTDDEELELLERRQPGITKTIDLIRSLRVGRWPAWDLHGGNLMQREDGTLVFTDPLV